MGSPQHRYLSQVLPRIDNLSQTAECTLPLLIGVTVFVVEKRTDFIIDIGGQDAYFCVSNLVSMGLSPIQYLGIPTEHMV